MNAWGHMSKVRKMLDDHRQEFISLHELIKAIQKADSCSLREAAQFVAQLLAESKHHKNSLSLYAYDGINGLLRIADKTSSINKLMHIVNTGNFQDKDTYDDIPF